MADQMRWKSRSVEWSIYDNSLTSARELPEGPRYWGMSGETLAEKQIYISRVLILQGLFMIPVFFLGRAMLFDYTAFHMVVIGYLATTVPMLFLFVFPLYEGISIRRQTRDFIDDVSWWYYLSLGLGVFYLFIAYSVITAYSAPLWMWIPPLIYLIPGWIGFQLVEQKSAERRAEDW